MKSITVEGENYVKAGVIARDLGYTADYVGQLCRSGKVTAQLVGRSWYVHEESLRDHKQSRYRSSQKSAHTEIKKVLHAKEVEGDESQAVSVHAQVDTQETARYADQQFYSRASKYNDTKYEADTNELLPDTSKVHYKTGRLGVRLGDAQPVSVESTVYEFDFNPTPREEIKFKGKLSVQDVPDPDIAVTDENESVKPVPVQTKKGISRLIDFDEKTSKIKVTSGKTTHVRKNSKKPTESNSEGVVAMQRKRILDRNPVGGTLKVHTLQKDEESEEQSAVSIVVATISSVVIATMLIGLESQLFVENGMMISSSYVFELSTLLASLGSTFN